MNIEEYVTVTIMAAVWIILEIVKAIIGNNSEVKRFFPLIAAVLGVLFVFWINAKMDFTLFLQGIASGFSATGLNEGINALFYSKGGDENAE